MQPVGNKQEGYNMTADKIKEIVSKMTLEEKASQLKHNAPAVKRLGIVPVRISGIRKLLSGWASRRAWYLMDLTDCANRIRRAII